MSKLVENPELVNRHADSGCLEFNCKLNLVGYAAPSSRPAFLGYNTVGSWEPVSCSILGYQFKRKRAGESEE